MSGKVYDELMSQYNTKAWMLAGLYVFFFLFIFTIIIPILLLIPIVMLHNSRGRLRVEIARIKEEEGE